ncbi:type II toxin-antitoxin system tRNA(fMet)-specific endonuclease VapC [Caedibacter taeniospiralis]|uniref:type II toxin-antitoxin system tRNA(fMet)-specific endonuclease VapC n=1 Tax=Caedibacter taeniospiralis TaxID=28907 RepID=UPI0018EED07E|nr:type II toxin-antitoxin system VapC family toxin [Caedibacter taeniospiralis]
MIKSMLDTNICIFIINERPPMVLERLKEYRFNEIAISSIVYSELAYGAYKSKKIDKNIAALAGFVAPLSILSFDKNAANEYGIIRSSLEYQGQLIGANDLLIAAHAKSMDVPLITNNLKEFSRVEGLTVIDWTKTTTRSRI